MNTKTTKTLVFAALIAAMILPFGGIQTVSAFHEGDEHVRPGGSNLPEGDEPYGELPTEPYDEPDKSRQASELLGTHLPLDAELGESETVPVKTPGHADWDKEHGEISMPLPYPTPVVVESDGSSIPDGETADHSNRSVDSEGLFLPGVEVIPSNSRGSPSPDDGANLPVESPTP